MRFVLYYLMGILQTYFCAVDIIDIMNGDHTKFHVFMTVLTGAVAIACFATAFNTPLNRAHGGDDE